ncbi:MAG: hypothetical protein HQ592_06660 [Planctomycetes bacterium]|nr:hypothetical protein [Planctomycetota bacterium]
MYMPSEIAAILELEEDCPKLSTELLAKLDAFLDTRPRVSLSRIQAGDLSERNTLKRLRYIANCNHRLRQVTPVAGIGETEGALGREKMEERTDGKRSENVRSSEPDGQSFLSPRDMARVFGLRYESLRKKLERFRRNNLEGWNEVTDPRPREARYVYQVAAVRSIIDAMKASGQTSSERPAKKTRPR